MGSVAVHDKGSGAIIATGSGLYNIKSALSKTEQPLPQKSSDTLKSSFDYAPAGDNDKMFLDMLDDAKSSTILSPGITFKAEMLYGGGVQLTELAEDGSLKTIRSGNFAEAVRKMNLSRALMGVSKDLTGLGSGYYQISLNGPGDKIVSITSHQSRCKGTRLGWRDNNGAIAKAYLNADFGADDFEKKNTKSLLVINTLYDPADWLKTYVKDGGKERHFIYPVQLVSLAAENYYPIPDWNSARLSDWLEVQKQIAKLKKHMIVNQMNIKYQFEIHEDYWPIRFGNTIWQNWSDQERLAKMESETEAFDDFFKGVEGGSVLMTNMLKESFGKEVSSTIKINEFKPYLNDGIHVEDSQEAAANILFALGLHPSIFGSGGSKGLGNSGSEGQVSYNQRKQNIIFYQDQLIQVLYLLRDFNGYDANVFPSIRQHPDLQTLDKVSPDRRTNQQPDPNNDE